ncbi:MAG TPA: hypothetical protein VFZ61_08680 [Polyangiales bacterium]
MQPVERSKQRGRRLLVAAVGLASVSYVGTIQGCAGDDPAEDNGEGALEAQNDEEGLAESQRALTLDRQVSTDLSTQIIKYGGLPGSGNLMAPDGNVGGGSGGIKVPLPVGNLMVSPVGDPIAPETLQAVQALEQR